jgi:hypothetical protein
MSFIRHKVIPRDILWHLLDLTQPDTQSFHFRHPPKPAAAKILIQAGHVAPRF